jgi:NADPH-dependent 2,4-dienoyl-CoA reductase/sulfur reductase-like enzyme
MAYSSILGAENAPTQPSGKDSQALGPSDNSDTGSDTIGTHEAHADSDAVGTGERGSVEANEAREGGDIMPDRVVNLADGEVTPNDDAPEMSDLDEHAIGDEAEEDE